MKPIHFFDLADFSATASGPFSFYNLYRGARTEAYWSPEDFDWILFHQR